MIYFLHNHPLSLRPREKLSIYQISTLNNRIHLLITQMVMKVVEVIEEDGIDKVLINKKKVK